MQTATDCTSYDSNPAAYRTGMTKFNFNSKFYGALDTKADLKLAQFNKCCYCEAIFHANQSGDVEHYRPKGGVGWGKNRVLPGYYWLAYSWDNLFYACADCNQYRKRAAFPLANEASRARDHHSLTTNESPLILCPSGPQNPRDHIAFNRDVPTWLTEAGHTTIACLKLDREALCASRRRHFRLLDALLAIIKWDEVVGSQTRSMLSLTLERH